jgi:hypothetical protein
VKHRTVGAHGGSDGVVIEPGHMAHETASKTMSRRLFFLVAIMEYAAVSLTEGPRCGDVLADLHAEQRAVLAFALAWSPTWPGHHRDDELSCVTMSSIPGAGRAVVGVLRIPTFCCGATLPPNEWSKPDPGRSRLVR